MIVYESHEGMYNFKHLPAFAAYILANHLTKFVDYQIAFSYQLNLPLLKRLQHLSKEEIVTISNFTSIEFLTALATNHAKEYLENSLETWATNTHELVGKFDLVAEDLTLLTHVRQKALQKWIPSYTNSVEQAFAINDEISVFILGNNTSGVNTLLQILTEEVQRKKQQLLEAQEIAKIGSFEWDFNTITRYNTPELKRIFETEDAQPFDTWQERIHPGDRKRVGLTFEKALLTGLYDCEFRYVIGNKEKVLWAKAIVHYRDDKPVSMSGTVQDVTERKKIEQDLLQKTHDLQLSNTNLERFAFVASHDLQEPLRKILIHTDLLASIERDNLSAKGKNLLDKISSSTRRMKTLIKDILNYSTINNNIYKETANLEQILTEVRLELEEVISSKRACISSDTLPDVPVFPSQIKQLFQNLVVNSLKFAKASEAPVINIKHNFVDANDFAPLKKQTGKYVKIQFSDNGIGFENQDASEIFSIFKRLHSQKEFEGAGLGLSICKKVVENHGGFIEAAGKPGEGATFTILLPVE